VPVVHAWKSRLAYASYTAAQGVDDVKLVFSSNSKFRSTANSSLPLHLPLLCCFIMCQGNEARRSDLAEALTTMERRTANLQ